MKPEAQNQALQGQAPPQSISSPELQLADIHLPSKPDAWPPAWGWWVLSTLLLALLTFSIIKLIRYRKRKKYQQRLLLTLTGLEKQLQQGKTTAAMAELNIMLRRLALMYYPRQKIASLTGKDWLVFLDNSGRTNDFTNGAGRLLADTPYLAKMPESADINGLIKVIRKWVKQISQQGEQA